MTKKIIALGLALALVGVSVVSGTLAYLTDTDKATNVFTVGKIDIELEEETGVYDVAGNLLRGKYHEFENGTQFSNILPTNIIKKEATIKNTGNNGAYVRAIVIVNNVIETWSAVDSYAGTVQENYDEIFNGWNIKCSDYDPIGIAKDKTPKSILKVDYSFTTADTSKFSKDNWFLSDGAYVDETQTAETQAIIKGQDYTRLGTGYYSKILAPEERLYCYYIYLAPGESVTLFDGLNVPALFTANELAMFENLMIEVYADAIQNEGFNYALDNGGEPDSETIAKRAFEALEVAHPMAEFDRPESIEDVDFGDSLVAVAEFKELNDTELSTYLEDYSGDYYEACGVLYSVTPEAEQNIDSDEAKYYNADFVVKSSKPLDEGAVALWGNYGTWGTLAFATPADCEANVEYRLLGEVASAITGNNLWITYEAIVKDVKDFACGVMVPNEEDIPVDSEKMPVGTTITVELRLYVTTGEADGGRTETGEYIVIDTYEWTYNG